MLKILLRRLFPAWLLGLLLSAILMSLDLPLNLWGIICILFVTSIVIIADVTQSTCTNKDMRYFIKSVQRIDQGDYNIRLDYNRSNVLGDVARVLNRLMDKVDNIPCGVYTCLLDEESWISTMNDQFLAIIGYSRESFEKLCHSRVTNIIYEEDKERIKTEITELLMVSPVIEIEYRVVSANGQIVWVLDRGHVMTDVHGKRVLEGIITDITFRKMLEFKLINESQRDGLTGLYNKKTTQRLVEAYIKDKKENGKSAFIIVDIDDFKSINDNLGHLFGDLVLEEIAAKLKRIFHQDSLVGRIGGDEFVVFIKNAEDDKLLLQKLETLATSCRKKFKDKDKDKEHNISASIGVSMYPQDGTSFEELYEAADQGLYYAKNRGKNCYQVYNKKGATS